MNNSSSTSIRLQGHPIVLRDVTVNQQTFIRSDTYQNEAIDGRSIEIGTRILPGNADDTKFKIGMRAVYGLPDENFNPQDLKSYPPITIIAEITGEFFIERKLPQEVIKEYKRTGGYFVLFPYIREQVYGISVRGGIKPIIIPPITVPVIKITPNGTIIRDPEKT